MGTGCARTDVVPDKGTDAWPGIFLVDEFQGSVLPKVLWLVMPNILLTNLVVFPFFLILSD